MAGANNDMEISSASEPAGDAVAVGRGAVVPWSRLLLFPAIVFAMLAAVTMVLWRQESLEQRSVLSAHVQAEQEHTARRLEENIKTRIAPVLEMRNEWRGGRLHNERQFIEAAGAIAQEGAEYSVIGWVTPDGFCRYITPLPGNEQIVGRPISEIEYWGDAFTYAQHSGSTPVGIAHHHPDYGTVFTMIVPVGKDEDDSLDGAIVAEIRMQSMLSGLLDPQMAPAYALELRDENGVIHVGDTSDSQIVTNGELLHVLDHHWYLRLKPTAQFVAAWSAREPQWVLVGGMAISLLVAGTLWQMLHHRWRDAELTRRHLTALEAVNQIAGAISGQPGLRQELVDRLASEPRKLLGVSRSFISIWNEKDNTVSPLSWSSDTPLPPEFPRVFPADSPPCMPMNLRDRRTIISNDVDHDASIFNMDALRMLSIKSLMMLPLIVRDRVIGQWTVTCDKRHAFRDVELRLARLWASQIAMTLANNHLLEQMNQSLEAQKQLAAQRDTLAAVNAAIFQASTVDETVRKIADLAPVALGVDMCMANLFTPPETLTVAAATGAFAGIIVNETYSMKGNNAERVLQSRQMLVIEDARDNPTLHPKFRDRLRVQSVIYMPMFRGDGSPIGMLVLVRHVPTTFSLEQRRLVQIFATRAAAALENAMLHEQTRRDADTKAMLLRELNHRVKNNLAGIIGLLSMGETELPDRARRWLDRAIERIEMMARAHELFAGGVEQVSLAELVAQMLPSLSVVKPAEVEIRTDLGGVDVLLRTDRAVSLVMVLHELCYNAIVHGVGFSGILRINASIVAGSEIMIEVENDEGRDGIGERSFAGVAVADRPQATSGLGLKLVDGLVRRELHGQFSLRPRDEGGTLATVRFPLLPDESRDSKT